MSGELENWGENWRIGELGRRVGELENWGIGELESWRVGELESWGIGDPSSVYVLKIFHLSNYLIPNTLYQIRRSGEAAQRSPPVEVASAAPVAQPPYPGMPAKASAKVVKTQPQTYFYYLGLNFQTPENPETPF